MASVKFIRLNSEDDEGRGTLVHIESGVPFEVKRVFYIYGVESPDVIRGSHGHKKCDHLLIPVAGTVNVVVDGVAWLLYRKDFGMLIPHGVMVEKITNFSEDCVLLVLASEHYDPSDVVPFTKGK